MEFLRPYNSQIIIALIVIVALQLGFLASLSARLNRTNKLVRDLLTGPEGEDLEALLQRCLGESRQAIARGDELEQRLIGMGTQMRACVQKLGVVRFDAYGDVSGEQSFSMALLDGLNNGAIITGLFGRTDSRCYGKAVLDGRTEQALSEEEDEALKIALNGGIATMATPTPARGKSRARAGRE